MTWRVTMVVMLAVPIALITLLAVLTGVGEYRRTDNKMGWSLLAVSYFQPSGLPGTSATISAKRHGRTLPDLLQPGSRSAIV
ncbi:hypothetical protein JWS13_44455 [Rhodococcus pseudokoreensis]|uniref:Uncharacterized protein n=1 Tax=Rhodococcus pseudokoreensis TaxID=2811421 RepID=A0A974WE14_9NOCA|nr:hypothetical protein [Rhodococcus opacus]QSE95165.1 hypothetical protein JWS13_44455 [Rhodococcus pseudokoreensis]